VLCNAILNNLATYYMCCFLLPKSVIESIDKRHALSFGPVRINVRVHAV
jgi:hypothetical protein